MSYISISNPGGVPQVDAVFSNFALAQKGTVTLANAAFGGGASTLPQGTITYSGGVAPVLALCGGTFWIWSVTYSSGTWTFSVVGAATGTFNYFIFDQQNQATPSDNFGLRCFDASGNLLYHTSAKPMRVVNAISSVGSVSLTSGPTYAVAQSNYNLTQTSISLGGGVYTNTTRATYGGISSTSLSATSELVEQFTSSSAQTSRNTGSPFFIALDVTNY